MSKKPIIIVVGIALASALGYLAYNDAVGIWQNLQDQNTRIEELNKSFDELDKELESTTDTKNKSQEEVEKLEEERKKLEEERKKLERELQAYSQPRQTAVAVRGQVGV